MIEDFKQYLVVERGVSPHTRTAYLRDIEQFFTLIKKEPSEVTKEDIIIYLKHLKDTHLATSINRKIYALKLYYRFLVRQKALKTNIFKNFQQLKTPKKVKEPLTVGQFQEIIEKVDDKNKERNILIFELLFATGVRASELISIRLDDVNFKERLIRVLGKGTKERYVPFGDHAAIAYSAYLNVRVDNNSSYLFPHKKGHISRQQLFYIVKKYSDPAISPHSFRHFLATNLLTNHADIRIVQAVLGHSDIATTQIYTHLDNTDIKNSYQLFHPRR